MSGVFTFVFGGLVMLAAALVPLLLLSMWSDWRANRD